MNARTLTALAMGLLLMLSACGTLTEPPPSSTDPAAGFAFHVDPEREIVTLLEPTALELHAEDLPSDTRILRPGEDIALKNLTYRFLSGNRLVLRLKVKNITTDLTFEQPFFFTLNEDAAHIKSATAPLVTDRDLGGDGVLSPGERTRKFTFEVKHKNRAFTFLIDTSAAVTMEAPDAAGKLAFVSNRDDNYEVYVMNADGSGQTRLTDHPAGDYRPAWQPAPR